VVLDAADMDADAQFWSALLDIPVVHRSQPVLGVGRAAVP
jgi:hypothetical protein